MQHIVLSLVLNLPLGHDSSIFTIQRNFPEDLF